MSTLSPNEWFQIVSGVGGVGKTTLAFKYVCRYAESYSDGVFYFNTESYPSVQLWLKENVSIFIKRHYFLCLLSVKPESFFLD